MNVLSSLDNILTLDPNHQHVNVLKEHTVKDLKKKFPKWKNPKGFVEIEADMVFPFPMNEPRKFFHVLGYDYDPKTTTVSFVFFIFESKFTKSYSKLPNLFCINL